MKINDILRNNKNINKSIKLLALSYILKIEVNNLLLYEKDLTKKELKKYNNIIKKSTKKPIQYILKEAYFYDDMYYVDKNVLIPRPETEKLVIETEKIIKDMFDKPSILEIGTGSGVIAITLKKLNKDSYITATDISKKALKIAKKNKKDLDIELIQTNITDGIDKKYDVIISNPPYIKTNDKNVEDIVKNNEPHIALFAEDNGLYFYKEILKRSKKLLNVPGVIAFEIGHDEKEEITNLAKKTYPNSKIITKKDYNDFDRYVFIINE